MRFQFSISYVPGKDLIIADTLSRAPVTDATSDDVHPEKPSGDRTEDEVIKKLQLTDPVCQQISLYCQIGWPDKKSLEGPLKPYFSIAGELSEVDGLLMRGSRIEIPPPLRQEMLRKIHGSYQGITKCRERARQCAWWPSMSSELKDLVKNCPECCKAQQ